MRVNVTLVVLPDFAQLGSGPVALPAVPVLLVV